ncbi:hypothetical protein DYB32_001112 [Aphanomyces invadans]|uniref:Uncharacterized protein n=1 Tax=Aphanomyces invadans TaxID=157072 RepID=A0A3R6Z9V0_9STRA|nr:hypothetical protein DYB32_001112 [Aphanomyces invadans]
MFQTWVHGIFHPARQVQSCPEPNPRRRGDSALLDDDVFAPSNRARANTLDDMTTCRRRSDAAVSAWDSKRQLCQNCKRIFLKFLSPCTAYCSLDCQSNAAYLVAVSEGIRAAAQTIATPETDTTVDGASSKPMSMAAVPCGTTENGHVPESAIEGCCTQLSSAMAMSQPKRVADDQCHVGTSPTTQGSYSSTIDFDQYTDDDDDDSDDSLERHTYADFYTEKLQLARPVEWNFSALY